MRYATKLGNTAVLGGRDPRTSAKGCLVHGTCKPFAPLEPCPKSVRPVEASALGSFVPAEIGESMSVRGRLSVGPGVTSAVSCRQAAGAPKNCCNSISLKVFVGDIPNGARLEGLTCGGDESRLCCEVPAFGQVVVATGKVIKESDSMLVSRGVRWSLSDVKLCSDDPTQLQSHPARGEGAPPR
jgi:hypothetical protein